VFRRACGAAREVEHLPLLGRFEPFNLLDNFVFERLRHCESNLGNARCEVNFVGRHEQLGRASVLRLQ